MMNKDEHKNTQSNKDTIELKLVTTSPNNNKEQKVIGLDLRSKGQITWVHPKPYKMDGALIQLLDAKGKV